MPHFDVSQAAPHELLPACRLLFDRYAGADRERHAAHCRDRLDSGGAVSGAFVARASGQLCAAALVQSLPGALGVILPPRGDSPEAEDAATAAACAWLRDRGAKVCQAFTTAEEASVVASLARNGFRHVTQLVSLRRELNCVGGVRPPRPSPLVLREHEPSNAARFAETLLATHEGSLDCPELNEARTAAELLDGFCQPQSFQAGSHHVLAYTKRDRTVPSAIGVLLLDESAEPKVLEIAYLGVVPEARRRGYGDWLIRYAIAITSERGNVLTVSVDARNAPAMKLYARHGFAETERSEVWLARL